MSFYQSIVNVHFLLPQSLRSASNTEDSTYLGVFCTRTVIAKDEKSARKKIKALIIRDLIRCGFLKENIENSQFIFDGLTTVSPVRLFDRVNKGFTLYERDE